MSPLDAERRRRLDAIEKGSLELRAAERRGDRYYIAPVRGWGITGHGRGAHIRADAPTPASYSILDRFVDFAEVARFTPNRSASDALCAERAEHECRRLNTLERSRSP